MASERYNNSWKKYILVFPILSSVISIYPALCTRNRSSSSTLLLYAIIGLTLLPPSFLPYPGRFAEFSPCSFIFSICILMAIFSMPMLCASSAIMIIESLWMSWIIFGEVFCEVFPADSISSSPLHWTVTMNIDPSRSSVKLISGHSAGARLIPEPSPL